jgi:hypothetical protein
LQCWMTNTRVRADHPVTWTPGQPVMLSQESPGGVDEDMGDE